MDNPFKTYLIQRGFRPQTIYGYVHKLQDYLNWCQDEKLNPKTTTLDVFMIIKTIANNTSDPYKPPDNYSAYSNTTLPV